MVNNLRDFILLRVQDVMTDGFERHETQKEFKKKVEASWGNEPDKSMPPDSLMKEN